MLKKLFILFILIQLISSCIQKKTNTKGSLVKNVVGYEQRIKNVFSNQEIVKIEQITAGLSDSKIYKVTPENKTAFIARFLDINRDEAEREWEISLMKETAKKGISPAIIFSSRNPELIVMDYIGGKNFNHTFFGDPLLKKLAKNLKSLHSLTMQNAVKIETMRKRFFIKSSTQEYQHFLDMFMAIEGDFLANSALGITHTDLHPGNMLADKENVWIIDWQDAGIYGQLFDVARVAVELSLVLSPNVEKEFLNAYFEREMTIEETVSYKKAQALVTMKIIDSLIHAYTKDFLEKDRNSTIIQLFEKAKVGNPITNPMESDESLIIYLLQNLFKAVAVSL